MDIDGEKLEQVVLALFQMNLSDDTGRRAWKSLPWSVMDSLHEKGYISDPATKAKSVWLSEEEAPLTKLIEECLIAHSDASCQLLASSRAFTIAPRDNILHWRST